MWTPKRILLLIAGFLFFFTCYQVYSFFLGRYDGLAPLPAEYRPNANQPIAAPLANASGQNSALTGLKEAFGEKCEEINRSIFEWRNQGIIIAYDQRKLLPNGRLLLSKVSVAIFSQNQDEQKGREINTIRGDEAEIEFERPIYKPSDVSRNKPIAGELRGNVILTNNRRSGDPRDDLRLLTPWLRYRDDQHRVWTEAEVRILDDSCGVIVTATGMDVDLIPADERTAKAPNKNPKNGGLTQNTVNGVKSVRLFENVRMELPEDGKSNFIQLGQTSQPKGSVVAAPQSTKPSPTSGVAQLGAPPKSLVVIESQGPFVYNVEAERAEFTDRVKVLRKNEPEIGSTTGNQPRYDQLFCDQLVIQFSRKKKNNDTAQKTNEAMQNFELVSARALGKQVDVSSDGSDQLKGMKATGVELHYDKAKNTTTMRGGPILHVEMQGYDLTLNGYLTLVHGERMPQAAHAQGPGSLRIFSIPGAITKQERKPILVTWRDRFDWTKDHGMDRIDLVGGGSFDDPEQGRLQASERIIVWVETIDAPRSEKASPDTPTNANNITQARVPRRLDAVGDVKLISPQLVIQKTDKMNLRFRTVDASEIGEPLTQRILGVAPSIKGPQEEKPGPRVDGESSPLNTTNVTPPKSPTSKIPLQLQARWIDADLLQAGSKFDLEKLTAEGSVHVHQAPQSEEDRVVDLRGERLTLKRLRSEHVIDLAGAPAVVQLDKIWLTGLKIHFDQPLNTVEVNDAGSMRLPMKTDFQGESLNEETELTISWTQRMFFDGRLAEFLGQVVAEQKQSRLTCGKLRVELDRKVSLKEKPQGVKEAPPELVRLVGWEGILFEQRGAKIGEYQRVRGREIELNNQAHDPANPRKLSKKLIVNGPEGVVEILAAGSDSLPIRTNDRPLTPTTKPSGMTEPVNNTATSSGLKLTRILFEGSLEAFKDQGLVIVRDQAQLFHLPSESIDIEINTNKLPPGCLWVTSNKLVGRTYRLPNQLEAREFEAHERVLVHAQEFTAKCDLLKYDDFKDQVILHGLGGNLAIVQRQKVKGTPAEVYKSGQIKYNRKDNTIEVNDFNSIDIRR